MKSSHVESFNGCIKGKYLSAYRRSGRLPRIDMWILTVVMKVMLSFFQMQKDKKTLEDYYQNLCCLGSREKFAVVPEPKNFDNDSQQIFDDLMNDSDYASDGTQDDSDQDGDNDLRAATLFDDLELQQKTATPPPHPEYNIQHENLSPLTPLPSDGSDRESEFFICSSPRQHTPSLLLEANDSNAPVPSSCPDELPMPSGDPMIGAFDKANEEVTCMQRLLAAEDALAREISLLLQITDTPSLVVPHISPSIRSRLCGTPEGIMDLPLFLKTSASPARPAQKSSIAPPISFCEDS